MITLSLLKLLEDNGFGEIDQDLWYQKLTLDKKGLYIADIGDSVGRHNRDVQSYEILSRGSSDVDGYNKLNEVRKFLRSSQGECELPAVPPISNKVYQNVEILKPSSITNVGLDAQNRVIYSMTGSIIYKGD